MLKLIYVLIVQTVCRLNRSSFITLLLVEMLSLECWSSFVNFVPRESSSQDKYMYAFKYTTCRGSVRVSLFRMYVHAQLSHN